MSYLLIILFFIFPINKSEEMTFSGFYNGKNVYIQNPFSINKKDFCIEKLFVNSILKAENPVTSAILIDLSNLQLNDPVEIRIVYKAGCSPQLINPEVLEKKNLFKFTFIQVNQYHLQWKTQFEEEGWFVIEKFIEEEWQEIGTIHAKGIDQEARYSFPSNPQEGQNRYRIKYIKSDGKLYFSNEVKFSSP